VLNWNGWEDTFRCLASLRASDDLPAVVVVDNGSSDGSCGRIRDVAPWVQLVALPTNVGFAAGMNAGIAAALAAMPEIEFVWVLNNDTIVDPFALSRMLALADSDDGIGLVGCRLVDADGSGRVQALGGGSVNRWLGTTTAAVEPTARGCDYLIGASVLVRRAVLEQVGGFDERFFFYLEDTDLSLRARRAGWRLAVAADAVVLHRGGASISGGQPAKSLASDIQSARSAGIFVMSLGLPWSATSVPLHHVGMVLRRVARRQPGRLVPIMRAYVSGLRLGRRPPRVPVFRAGSVPRAGSTRNAPDRGAA
jgi:glycosyltransferase involved in cell wall biosynthesis